jgi:hypothetical protein
MGVLGLAILVVVLGVIDRAAPYQPFVVKSYTVLPQNVCTKQPVTARISRRFTDQVSSFSITESWVIAKQAAQGFGKPIGQGGGGSLPPSLLNPSKSYKVASSPVIHNAPSIPGVYVVRIETQSQGRRFGIPVAGESEFYSDNSVHVRRCR